MQSAYETLGLQPGATAEQVRVAYLARVKILHPDRHADAPADVQEVAAAEFRKVQEAYDTLTSDSARAGPSGGDGTTAEVLLAVAIRRASMAHSLWESNRSFVESQSAIVFTTAELALDDVRLPANWPGDPEAGRAHEALCAAMDRLASRLINVDPDDATTSPALVQYLIAYVACSLVDDLTQLPRGLTIPVTPADRLEEALAKQAAWTGSPPPTDSGSHSSSAGRSAQSGSSGPLCEVCGDRPAEAFSFRSVTGFVIVWRWATLKATLCGNCALNAGRDMQATTLTFGWLGVISAVLTPFIAIANALALDRAALLSRQSGKTVTSEKVFSRPGPRVAMLLLVVGIAVVGLAVVNNQTGQSPASSRPTVTTSILSPTTAAPDYPWAVGNCVSLPNAQNLIRPVGCNDPNSGFIFAEALRPEDCPLPRTDQYVEDDGRTLCIDAN